MISFSQAKLVPREGIQNNTMFMITSIIKKIKRNSNGQTSAMICNSIFSINPYVATIKDNSIGMNAGDNNENVYSIVNKLRIENMNRVIIAH